MHCFDSCSLQALWGMGQGPSTSSSARRDDAGGHGTARVGSLGTHLPCACASGTVPMLLCRSHAQSMSMHIGCCCMQEPQDGACLLTAPHSTLLEEPCCRPQQAQRQTSQYRAAHKALLHHHAPLLQPARFVCTLCLHAATLLHVPAQLLLTAHIAERAPPPNCCVVLCWDVAGT